MIRDKQYTIGLDFGSLSARGVLADAATGEICAEAAAGYPHGVMDRELPDGTRLPPGWALQNPQDYAEALESYRGLYREYRRLHDYFGRGGNTVMEKLTELRNTLRF